MPPHEGLVHLKQYDIRDSNVELIGSDIDHRVKYNSAATEPAWNDGRIGQEPGLFIWRIENFEVIPWPKDKTGLFYDGDSYIVLHSYKVGNQGEPEKLGHDIFFWLGSKTSQDEAGTAAYKTVELDEFVKGVATQHREIQQQPSDAFLALFPHLKILSGGVQSGFRHVEQEAPKESKTLLRVFKSHAKSVVVYEVEPTWQSLNDGDVFILDKGDKIWVWQGKTCSPIEKARAAQVVHDMTIAKHVDVEVISQNEPRSSIIFNLLGGKDAQMSNFDAPRPVRPVNEQKPAGSGSARRKLFRISDASGDLTFDLVKDGDVQMSDLDSNDVFLLDVGDAIWVWQGHKASKGERAVWFKIAQIYAHQLQKQQHDSNAVLLPIAKVVQGNESRAFLRAIEV